MLASLRWLVIPAVFAAVLGFVPMAQAANEKIGVDDRAGMFGKPAVAEADNKIAQIKKDYGKGVVIETIASVAEADREKTKNKNVYFTERARKRYRDLNLSGIYVLISKDPQFIKVVAGDRTKVKAFPESSLQEVYSLLVTDFKQDKFDAGLLSAVSYIDETLEKNIGKGKAEARPSGKVAARPAANSGGGGGGIWGWVCIGIVALLGIWLVFGLIRAFTGGGGGGAGGPGYGAAGGGGGGMGGFFPSLLGGLFGAAAGMYLYDSFFRSSTPTTAGWDNSAQAGGMTGGDAVSGEGAGGDWGDQAGTGAGGAWGDDSGSTGGDWGDDGGSTGGDWGGGDAGGDWGAGGGDWGGGGDGGDW